MEKDFFYRQLVKSFGATAAQEFYRVSQQGDTGKGLIAMANRHRLKIVRQSSRSFCDYSNNTLGIQSNVKELTKVIILELNNYKNRREFEKVYKATVKLLQNLPLNTLQNKGLMSRYAKEFAYKQFYIEMLSNKDAGRMFKDYRDRHPRVSLSKRVQLLIRDYENLCAGKTSLEEWTKTRMKIKWRDAFVAGNLATSHEEYYMNAFYRNLELIINRKIRAQSESSRFKSISSHKPNQLPKKPKRQGYII